MSVSAPTLIDVRTIPPSERHALILSTFARLGSGESMELVNDHDPKPLQAQLQAIQTGRFEWQYLQAGPEVWHVRIAKPKASDHCCGGCGGA